MILRVNGNIASELSTLFGQAQRGNFNHEHYHALSQLVIEQVPNADIWSVVIDLIARIRPAQSLNTPPPSGIVVPADALVL